MANNVETNNNEPQVLVYPVEAINNIIGIIDRQLNVQGIAQIRAVSDILGILSNPYKQMGLQEIVNITENQNTEQAEEQVTENK